MEASLKEILTLMALIAAVCLSFGGSMLLIAYVGRLVFG